MTAVTEKRVNAALRRAGVPVEVWTQKGYRSVRTLDPTSPEIDSIFVCYWHQMSLSEWVAAATYNYKQAVAVAAAAAAARAARNAAKVSK